MRIVTGSSDLQCEAFCRQRNNMVSHDAKDMIVDALDGKIVNS